MKKILKIFVIALTIIIIFIGAIVIRKYLIIKKIYDLQKDINLSLNNIDNFFYEDNINIKANMPDTIRNAKTQIYYKQGIYKVYFYKNDELTNITYYNTHNNDSARVNLDLEDSSEIDLKIDMEYIKAQLQEETMLHYGKSDFKTILKDKIFNKIQTEENQYIVIDKKNGMIEYISKQNGLIEKRENSDFIENFAYTENIVTDKDVQKP